MKRILLVVGVVVAAIALVGAGILVGSKVGAEKALEAAAEAQGPMTDKDALILTTFSDASAEFERLLAKAEKGKDVGKQLTQQAVIVLRVEQNAEGPKFKEAVGDTADAMLLLSAGIIADDGSTVQQGIDAYQKAQEKLLALAEEVKAAREESGESDGGPEPAAPSEGEPATPEPGN